MTKRDTFALLAIFLVTPVVLTMLISPNLKSVMMGEIKDLAPMKQEIKKEVTEEGVVTQTIDATKNEWAYFSFDKGVVTGKTEEDLPSDDWHLAFNRKRIVTNSPPVNDTGKVTVLSIEDGDFNSKSIQTEGKEFVGNLLESNKIVNKVFEKWYDYNFFKHTLTPKKNLYLIKGNDNRVVKMMIEKYYCGSDKTSGCYTLKYAWMDK